MSAAQTLSQLRMPGGRGPVRPSTSSIVTGEGLPVLAKKLRERILAGEFVDFTELPPAKGKVRTQGPPPFGRGTGRGGSGC